MIYVWLGLLIFFGVLEGLTAGLASIWFALGALVALLAASIGSPVWLQILWFVLVSALALVALRPLTRKYLNNKKISTNADRVIGQIGVVQARIDNIAASGAVFALGKVWTARSDNGQPIEVGADVRVLRIEGVKLIVEPSGDAMQPAQQA